MIRQTGGVAVAAISTRSRPFLGDHERLRRRHDPELAPVVVDDADFLGADAVVDPDRTLIYETPPAGTAGAASSLVDLEAASRAIFIARSGASSVSFGRFPVTANVGNASE